MSEATLGQLVIQLVANTVRFEGDLGKAAEIARDKMGEIHGFFKSNLALVATELSGATAGLLEFFHLGVERSEDLRVMGETLALTTESMSQLAYAAKQSDVPIETFQTGMKQLAKQVGLAAAGNTDAVKRFDALKVSIRDAHTGAILPLDNILSQVAERFSSFADSPIKVADAIAIMGRAGEQMLPFLNEGAKAIEEMRKRSDELGFTLDTGTSLKLKEFNEKWKDLIAVWEGVKTKFAANIAPVMTTLVEDLVKANQKLDIFNRSFGLVAKGFSVVEGAWSAVGKVLSNAGDMATKWWDSLKRGDIAGALAAPFDMVKKNINDIPKAFEDALDYITITAQKEKVKRPNQAPSFDFDKASIAQQYDEVYDELNKKTIESELRQTHTFEESADKWKGTIQHFATDYYHIWDDMQEYAKEGAQGIGSDLEQFFEDPFKEGLKGLLLAFIKTIDQMVAKALTAQILSSLFGGSKADGASSGLGGIFGNLLTSGSGAISGGRAGGGPVSAGSSYIVGENGPELFTPTHGGNIIPNGGGAGATNFNHTYYIDAKGADADRIQRILPAMMEQTRAATKRDIVDAFRRSGLPAPRFI